MSNTPKDYTVELVYEALADRGLPEIYAHMAAVNASNDKCFRRDMLEHKRAESILLICFSWSASPEGWEFWHMIWLELTGFKGAKIWRYL